MAVPAESGCVTLGIVWRVFQPPAGIRPQMFKTLVGRGHPEFSTKRQQDAQEYLLHLLAMVEVSLLLAL